MSDNKFGFIGTGNMGSALARAVRKTTADTDILLSNRSPLKAKMLGNELNCVVSNNKTIAETCQYIFLGVKPQMMKEAIDSIAPVLSARQDRFIIVTMAAGIKISQYKEWFHENYPIIRIMPNTPVAIGEGVVLYTASPEVFMDEITEFCEALKFAGMLDQINENLIDAASAISGCGPAFAFLFAESLADAGVECGLPRDKAVKYAAKTISGSGSLINATEKHPAQLKDEVCSPGGTTIAGVHSLESAGFRGAVMDAVKASFDKTKKLS